MLRDHNSRSPSFNMNSWPYALCMCGGTGLATQYCSGRSECCAWHSQHAEYATARGLGACPPGGSVKLATCSEIV